MSFMLFIAGRYHIYAPEWEAGVVSDGTSDYGPDDWESQGEPGDSGWALEDVEDTKAQTSLSIARMSDIPILKLLSGRKGSSAL
jgi:hypothetical protein